MSRSLSLAIIIGCIALCCIVFKTQRHESVLLIANYAIAFAAYVFILIKTKTQKENNYLISIGILLRGVFLFSFPNLSDDIYRFIWDGRLTNLGISPFVHPPQYFIDNQLFTQDLTSELFSKLNSPNYFSVYPSVCQAVFALAVFIFPKSIFGAALVIKFFLFICEIGTLFLIKKIITQNNSLITNRQSPITNPQPALIYALNPLILIELNANAHFEAAMIFFFMVVIYLLSQKPKTIRWGNFKNFPNVARLSQKYRGDSKSPRYYAPIFAMFAWSLSISTKMLPLLFMPLLWKYTDWKKSIQLGIIGVVFIFLLLLPIYNPLLINNLSQSLNLYFNDFEFNASIYYLLKELGLYIFGYNPVTHIARLTTIFIILFVLKKTFLEKINYPKNNSLIVHAYAQFAQDCLFILCVYFLTTRTVHPWYAAFPLALGSLTHWRFPIVWTGLIILTYAGYTEGSSKHDESYILVAIEYVLTFVFFLWEYHDDIPKRLKQK